MFQFFTPILDEVLEDIEGGRFSVQVNGNKTDQTNKFCNRRVVNIKSIPKYSENIFLQENVRKIPGQFLDVSACIPPSFFQVLNILYDIIYYYIHI